ncbi:MAG: DUF2125 domain-containing protein [Alphaproteobacteria bacterium]|nr:DUF2125 domain-containing protein [Alphaproteobacteria bacterium]HPF45467.1 DUF2125 domain-containing protein [Emcibacteraceae bacterium]HRW28576.1 DUF2125 domain-containing protein [Emcibacteraceae bacterium]
MRFKLIVASVLIIIAGYSYFWFHLAGQAKSTTLDWVENSEKRLGGAKIFVGDVKVSGFPYKIIIEVSSLNAVVPAGRVGVQPLSIDVPEIAVIFQPWDPKHAILVTKYFDVTQGPLDDPDLNVTFDDVKTSVILDPETMDLNNLSTVAEKISWYHGVEAEPAEISVMEKAQIHLRRSTGQPQALESYDLPVNRAVYFKAQNVLIREFANSLLGEKADNFKIEAMLHANEQPDYSVRGLSKWRDEGGTVSISSFEYGTPQSNLSLSGDVTLDENLKPLGAFDAKVVGMGKMLEQLSKNMTLPETARLILKGQAQNDSLSGEVPLSISMQNGLLYLGPIQLMELPAVVE